MSDKDKVQSRYPHASAEQGRTREQGEWGVWSINRVEQKRLNEKHWPEAFGRALLGLGGTEAEAWADAARYLAPRGNKTKERL